MNPGGLHLTAAGCALAIVACKPVDLRLVEPQEIAARAEAFTDGLSLPGATIADGVLDDDDPAGPTLASFTAPLRVVPGGGLQVGVVAAEGDEAAELAIQLDLADRHVRVPLDLVAGKQSLSGTLGTVPEGLVRGSLSLVSAGGEVGPAVDATFVVAPDSETASTEVRTFGGHVGPVGSIAFGQAPDGREVVVSGGDDLDLVVHDLEGGRELARMQGHTQRVLAVAVSPSGTFVASGGQDHTVRLWEPGAELPLVHTWGEALDDVTALAWAPDGSWLVSGSWDGTLRIRDPAGPLIADLPLGARINDLALSASGGVLVAATGLLVHPGALHVIETDAWEVVTVLEPPSPLWGEATAVSLAPDGSVLAAAFGRGSLALWDTAAGELLGAAPDGPGDTIVGLIVPAPGQPRVLGASLNGNVFLLDAGVLQTEPTGRSITAVALSRLTLTLAIGHEEGALRTMAVGQLGL